jgi:drug/metabolite transporter (DMT)-like permease
MSGAAMAAFLQFFATHAASSLVVPAPALFYALLIAVFATVLPSFFMSAALHRISAQANGTIGTLSPLATIILAAVVLDERLSLLGWAGALLVLAGVGSLTISARTR